MSVTASQEGLEAGPRPGEGGLDDLGHVGPALCGLCQPGMSSACSLG